MQSFQLLLVATTELLVPAAPPTMHACSTKPWTIERALDDLATLHDLPLESLQSLRGPVRASLQAALHDDRISDKNGTFAPWLVPRLSEALAASPCNCGVDEAAMWRDQAPVSNPRTSPLGALQSLHLHQSPSPAYVLETCYTGNLLDSKDMS